jgi:hypothetical protein
MGFVELELIHGRIHHGRGMELKGKLARVGEDEDGLWGCAHHVMGELQLQQLGLGRLEVGDRALGTSMS